MEPTEPKDGESKKALCDVVELMSVIIKGEREAWRSRGEWNKTFKRIANIQSWITQFWGFLHRIEQPSIATAEWLKAWDERHKDISFINYAKLCFKTHPTTKRRADTQKSEFIRLFDVALKISIADAEERAKAAEEQTHTS